MEVLYGYAELTSQIWSESMARVGRTMALIFELNLGIYGL